MQRKYLSGHVDWTVWLRTRPGDVRRPDKMIVRLGAGWRCLLCDRPVQVSSRAEHHLEHMIELDAWQADQEQPAGPKPDSIRRSDDP